jgi:hypothetical protein
MASYFLVGIAVVALIVMLAMALRETKAGSSITEANAEENQ